jgi:hypothetical protein
LSAAARKREPTQCGLIRRLESSLRNGRSHISYPRSFQWLGRCLRITTRRSRTPCDASAARREHPLNQAAFDDPTRWLLRWLGIEPKIRKQKGEHGSGLGKVRWVVERTISWLKGLRRMRIRCDRLGIGLSASFLVSIFSRNDNRECQQGIAESAGSTTTDCRCITVARTSGMWSSKRENHLPGKDTKSEQSA